MTDWSDRGACKGLDPNIFYPTEGDDRGIEIAKSICSICPVQNECLEYSLAVREQDGVWGGATERERRNIIRQRRRAAFVSRRATEQATAAGQLSLSFDVPERIAASG